MRRVVAGVVLLMLIFLAVTAIVFDCRRARDGEKIPGTTTLRFLRIPLELIDRTIEKKEGFPKPGMRIS